MHRPCGFDTVFVTISRQKETTNNLSSKPKHVFEVTSYLYVFKDLEQYLASQLHIYEKLHQLLAYLLREI